MDQDTLNELKKTLEKEKALLAEELRSFAQPDKNVKGDWDAKYQDLGDSWDENSQEVTEYATRLPLEHELEVRLQNVTDALEKITNNTYSICEKCGEVISIERLKAEPSARVCTSQI